MSFSEWKEAKLSDIAEITMGQSPKGDTCNSKSIGMPLLNGPTEFGINHPSPTQFTIDPKKVSKKGDLLFCVRGSTTGRMNWSDQPYAIGRGIAAISPIHKNTDRFVKATIELILPQILSMATGSTFPNVSKPLLNDFEILVPDVFGRININKVLKCIEDKIEVNNQINKTLENMAQAIFKQWFVDFEFPNEDGDTYKSSPGEMVESELGVIPKGWEVKSIGDLTEVVSKGTTPTKLDIDKAIDQSVIKFLKVKDINDDGTIEYTKLENIPKSVHENQLKRSILCGKDILLSIAGTIGRVSYVDEKLINANTNQAVAFVRLKNVEKYFYLILYKFKSSQFQESINSKVVQGVQANISLTVIKNEKVVEPTTDILELYNNTVNSIFKQVEILNNQNCSLKDIRDTLLPKLMSGEIRVPLDSEGEAS
jgi:type I restriction enzyme S subunit